MSRFSGQQLMSFRYDTVPHKEESPLELLRVIDWDFPERVAHSEIEGIHPYPAKFIAEIPRTLVSALPFQDGTAVLDLFCGSGTTLVECQRKGMPSIGIDLNPIACLISRVKTSECPVNLKVEALRVVERAKKLSSPTVPPIPNLDHWFKRGIQEELASLTEVIARAPARLRDCLRLALSSIIVRISNQESDTRYAAITKDIERKDVAILFLRAVERILMALHARHYDLTESQVLEGDTLQLAPEQIGRPISLVVTSPPYPNAYEYWLYH